VATDAGTGDFAVRTRLSQPYFDGSPPSGQQSLGLYIGAGSDDDYLKIVATGSGGQPAIEIVHEIGGVPSVTTIPIPNLLAGTGVDLELDVDPVAGTVRPRVAFNGGALQNVGPLVTLTPGSKLHAAVTGAPALAVGLIATSRGSTPFAATWDYIEVVPLSNVGVTPSALAAETRLGAPRPNPSSGAMSLNLALAVGGTVDVGVFDVAGRRVATLWKGALPAGTHPLRWDGRDASGRRATAGVYLIRSSVGGRVDSRRALVVR